MAGRVTASDVKFHLAAETDITADRERHELVSARGTQAAVDAARWQPCILRTDKAVAELGYEPIISHATGLKAVRNSVAVSAARHRLGGRKASV